MSTIKSPASPAGVFLFFPRVRISFIKNNLGALHGIFFMIKLNLREMKKLSRILTAFICCAPFGLAYGSTVATTSGSNLTAFNPSTANNNQWATLSNGRSDAVGKSAKADFGNCNSVVLRCAQPKCGNGGCADSNVASSIVAGCVKTNENCKQYGDDLINFMTAQLVASANVKINQQNLAAQQAAAAAASEQSQQQMAAMQQQMQQMQQQMQQQQAESAQQLQAALAAQQEQSQKALEEMKSAATNAAMENEAGISAYQQDAINRGVGLEVLERQKITGQIMTEIEDAEVSIKAMKTAMQNSFEYAHCDARGNSCEGPKRVKKWRELARDFIEPYDNSIDKIYNALETAQTVGVDLSQIYMMLNDACNSWGQYMCPNIGGNEETYIQYDVQETAQKSAPKVCPKSISGCYADCQARYAVMEAEKPASGGTFLITCNRNCEALAASQPCRPCTLLKVLTDADSVYEGWVNAETGTKDGNTTVVACASGALDGSKLFARRAKRKKGGNLVDVEVLDMWLSQVEPSAKPKNEGWWGTDYCDGSGINETLLQKAALKKSVESFGKDTALCRQMRESTTNPAHSQFLSQTQKVDDVDDCELIHPAYAICDAHPYNVGVESNSKDGQNTNNCTSYVKKTVPDVRIAIKQQGAETCEKYKILFCEPNEKDDGYDKEWFKIPKEPSKSCAPFKYVDKDSEAYKIAQREYEDSLVNDDVREMLGLKTTVISQQMYKQYEYINATLRRLKTQLQKAVLTSTLEAAGAKSEDGSGSSAKSLLGGGKNSDKTIHLAGAENCTDVLERESQWRCLQSNASLVKNTVDNDKKNSCLQLQDTLKYAQTILGSKNKVAVGDKDACYEYNKAKIGDKSCKDLDRDNIRQCASAITNAVIAEKEEKEEKKNQLRFITGG